jgi:hypothetical protein
MGIKGVEMDLAPIILFVYNRPWHTEQTVEALKNNELATESNLFIFSDGPKVENDENVKNVREYIKTIDGFKSVTIVEREKNIGLANSVITGVTEIVNRFGKVVVLEDDLVTSKYFLKFMNEALEIYKNENEVVCISAFVPEIENLPEFFFIRGADCWGWATWKRGWDVFESNGKKLFNDLENRNLLNEFDINGFSPRSRILKDQIEKKNDSWAIRWLASAFLNNKFCLYPRNTLIKNIGLDDSGTNSKHVEWYNPELLNLSIVVKKIKVEECEYANKKIEECSIKWNFKNNKCSLLSKIKLFITKL